MENTVPTENLLTPDQWFTKNLKGNSMHQMDWIIGYANYKTAFHLNALCEEIKEKAETQMCQDGKGCGVSYCDIPCDSVSKSSIESIKNNYLKKVKQSAIKLFTQTN